MKIAIISDFIDPAEWGGAAKVAAEQAKSLYSLGHTVIVISPSFSNVKIPDIEHVQWQYRRGIIGILKFRKELKHHTKIFSPDLAILHQPFSGSLFQLLFPKIRSRYFFHSSWVDEMVSLKSTKGIAIKGLLEKYVLTHSEKIFIASPFTKSVLQRRVPEVASNAIENPLGVHSPPFNRISSESNRNQIRSIYNIPNDDKIVSIFRRLIPRTGVDLFLNVLVKCQNITALIGGMGYMKDQLKQQAINLGIGKKVRFLDYVEENQMVKILQASDAAIVPSLELEGFGLSTVEAMVCGCPVVATPVGNNINLIRSCNGGVISESINEIDILKALNSCLNAHWDRHLLSQKVLECYNWDRHVKKMIE